MQQPSTHRSLIVKLKDGRNEVAWEQFFTAYEPFLRRLASRQGVPDRHVADVTQQVLLAIARSIEGWTDDGNPASFRRWLTTVSRNIVIKFMTRERRQISAAGGTEILEQLQQVSDEPDPQQVQSYEHELIVWAAEAVRNEFIESSWAAFWATTIDGQSVSTVATKLGISPGSIYMSRSRIMSRIRKKISEIME